MTIEELRKKREGVLVAMKTLEAKGNTEALSDEDDAEFASLKSEQEQLASAIGRSESVSAANALSKTPVARLASPEGPVAVDIPGVSPPPTLGTQADIAGMPTPKLLGGIQLEKPVAYTGPNGRTEAYCAGMFVLAANGNVAATAFCKDNGLLMDVMNEGDNALGGVFVIPEFMLQAMIVLRNVYGKFRANVNVRPMSSDVQTVPRWLSSTTAYFIGENEEATASDMKHDSVNMVAKKLVVLTKVSNELLADAVVDLGETVTRDMAYAMSLKEDQCGFIGTGSSTFGGIVGATIKLAEDASGGSLVTLGSGDLAYSDIVVADFEAMLATIPQYAIDGGNCKWYMSRAGWWASIARLQLALGGNTGEDMVRGLPPAHLGFPIVLTDVMDSALDDTASTMKCMFGDLRMAATLGDRRQFGIKVSDQRYFEFDQTAFMGLSRLAINVHDTGTASVAGPLVGLATPAS